MNYKSRYMKRYRAAKKAEKRDANGYEISLVEMTLASVSYVASNGQDSSSESEGMCYEDIADFMDSEIQLTESDMKTNDSIKVEDIRIWQSEFNIPINAVTKLLHILRKDKNLDLPLDARTILNFPRKVDVIGMANGKYIYLGVESGIVRLITRFPDSFNKDITFDLNIDGLPLFSSSGGALWPTLCRITNFQPFVVSLFYGHSKPDDVHLLLSDLLLELKELETKEISVNNKTFKLKLRAFICDAPARQMIKCIISHNGYYSCERCKIEGIREYNRVVFPLPNPLPEMRNDHEFNSFQYKDRHQKEVSPLVVQGLNISCINDFVLDSMHMVFLGVVKKMLKYYHKYGNPASLSKQNRDLLDKKYKQIKRLPQEFARQPRSLEYVDRFKATEYRTLILYTGPVIMKGILKADHYKHFLYLTIAMSVLFDEDAEFRNENLDFALQNLLCFVKYAPRIFGMKFMSYNTHSIIHLVDDVKRFRCSLNEISAFFFENHLRKLKPCVTQGNNPITQVVKKIKGLENSNLDQRPFKKEMKIGQHLSGKEKADSFFMLRDHVAIVVKKKNEETYKCCLFKKCNLENFFIHPSESKHINIYYLRDEGIPYSVRDVHVSELKTKMVGIRHGLGNVLIKLRHT